MTPRRSHRPPVSADPREAAADWLMREEDGQLGPDGLAARDAWLAEHPDHAAAHAAAGRAMGRLDGVAADPHIVALREAALRAEPEAPRSRWRAAAAIAAGVLLLAGGGLTIQGSRSPSSVVATLDQITHPTASIYRTDVGQRTAVTLPDGSVATLNTDTVLRVAYTGGVRGVRLVRGQALFEVAHGQPRPFEVYAADRVVTAVGTVFDVRLDGSAVKVALVEGKVKVRSAARPRPSLAEPAAQVMMAPGEVLEAAPSAPMQIETADISRETSWRSGFLIFEETPLAEAVAELNRYSRAKLVIDDPTIAALPISGSFKTGDPDRFARTVAEILPVSLERRGGGDLILSGEPESIRGAG